ncbi:hypothetical protein NT04LS_3027, partial [Listeria seeligeri FSL S4-171]
MLRCLYSTANYPLYYKSIQFARIDFDNDFSTAYPSK